MSAETTKERRARLDSLLWLIERADGKTYTVRAYSWDVNSAGVLVFKDDQGSVFLLYAPGTWIAVERQ